MRSSVTWISVFSLVRAKEELRSPAFRQKAEAISIPLAPTTSFSSSRLLPCSFDTAPATTTAGLEVACLSAPFPKTASVGWTPPPSPAPPPFASSVLLSPPSRWPLLPGSPSTFSLSGLSFSSSSPALCGCGLSTNRPRGESKLPSPKNFSAAFAFSNSSVLSASPSSSPCTPSAPLLLPLSALFLSAGLPVSGTEWAVAIPF